MAMETREHKPLESPSICESRIDFTGFLKAYQRLLIASEST